MPGLANWLDIAALLAGEPAFDPLAITAGAGADGVEQDGLAVDRFAIQQNAAADLRRRGLSAGLFIAVRTTLAATETMTLIANAQDADDSAFTVNAADFAHRASAQPPTIALPTLSIGPGVLTDERDTLKQQYDLTGARRYLRCQFTCTLSAAGVDTADVWGLWIFAGAQHNAFQSGLVGSSAVVS